ncbi:MAG: DNA cytosine methyltransferase [Bacteroidales bacterium]|nr:DNA cytosine methyltransferase [Bacteroidales bacterium]
MTEYCKIPNNYVDEINSKLQPCQTEPELVLDLFAGCGGLSLGFEAAGYLTQGYECVAAAADSYSKNLNGNCTLARLEVGYDYPEADIIIGGPPCQPFSVRGKQRGMEDARDGFPIFIDAVRRLQPRLFLFENVRNLVGTHKWYFDLIVKELEKLHYIIEWRCLNAVNYGVPQNRERVVVVGHRSEFKFPRPRLFKHTVSDAIGDTMYTVPEGSHILTARQDEYIASYEKKSSCVNPRDLYPDRPARTITCRNLAGATSDMQRVKLPDGRRRRITQSEAARLQSFPDWFEFQGNETEQFNQIGNAVPPLLAYQLAQEVKTALSLPQKSPATISQTNNIVLFPSLFDNAEAI